MQRAEVQRVSAEERPAKRISIAKVVLNIGVGKSGEALEKAKKVLEQLTGHQPCIRIAKKSIRDFGIQKREPIAAIVTLRREDAMTLLKRLLAAKENRIPLRSFSVTGTCSFGIKEHIEIPGIKYDPEIGIYGMDVAVVPERMGFRVGRRRRARSRVGMGHRISREEAINFFKERLGVEAYE